MTPRDLATLDRRELAALLRAGHAIDPRALDDTEYFGTSLGLPRVVERLTWKHFVKTFHRDGAALRGWNVKLKTGATFGHYAVVAARGERVPAGCDRGLLLRYRSGALARVRDPLVALSAGSVELLLGWTYLDLGVLCGTPSFFCLERMGPLRSVAQ